MLKILSVRNHILNNILKKEKPAKIAGYKQSIGESNPCCFLKGPVFMGLRRLFLWLITVKFNTKSKKMKGDMTNFCQKNVFL